MLFHRAALLLALLYAFLNDYMASSISPISAYVPPNPNRAPQLPWSTSIAFLNEFLAWSRFPVCQLHIPSISRASLLSGAILNNHLLTWCTCWVLLKPESTHIFSSKESPELYSIQITLLSPKLFYNAHVQLCCHRVPMQSCLVGLKDKGRYCLISMLLWQPQDYSYTFLTNSCIL